MSISQTTESATDSLQGKPKEAILKVEGLRTLFDLRGGRVPAVDGVDLEIRPGECLGVVGESGSGKSVTALSILGLVQSPGRIAEGRILFEGENLVAASPTKLRDVRGNRISMIFQEPMTSLNPVYTIGDQIIEAIQSHRDISREEARKRAAEMLTLVGIPDAETRLSSYPHQLSGGMRQRIMIAMALSCEPALLIADEPTTALDVTIQAQILELVRQLRKKMGTAVLMITHDLGVIAELADRVVVMYAGQVVETAGVFTLFEAPGHPYTEGLLKSIPKLDEERDRLLAIAGTVPNPQRMPQGCRFHPRCPCASDICRTHVPPLMHVREGQAAACWKHTNFELPAHDETI